MKKATFICQKCGHKFTVEILEKDEVLEKRIPTSPVRCKECGSSSVERR